MYLQVSLRENLDFSSPIIQDHVESVWTGCGTKEASACIYVFFEKRLRFVEL